jgi:hypothetical protein
MAALARIVRVRPMFVLSFALRALLTSAAVESNDVLFESRTLERHSAARKVDAATPSARMRPPIRAARRRFLVCGTPWFTASPNCDVSTAMEGDGSPVSSTIA